MMEVRQTGAGEPAPPMPEEPKTAEHKNAEVVRAKGNAQAFIKIGRRNHMVVLGANSKGLDSQGQPVAVDLLLRNGNRVDVVVEPLPQLKVSGG